MTHLKIQRIKFFIFFLILLLFQIAACDGNFRNKRQAVPVPSNNEKDNKEADDKISKISKVKDSPAQIKNNNNNTSVDDTKKAGGDITSIKATAGTVTTIKPSTSTVHNVNSAHITSMNSGALVRGISVIIGLSVLVMAYMVFRSFRLNKTRAQMVRKYGVLAHRQDVEMRPLPLDEDDEDDTTVFDASNISSHRLQTEVS